MLALRPLILVCVAGCGSAHEPAVVDPVPAPDPVSDPAPDPVADRDQPPVSTTDGRAFRATTSMVMEGTIDRASLLQQLGPQLASLDSCVAKIRATDQVVGSLNVQVTIAATGAVAFDVQSDVNDDARSCLRAGLAGIHIVGAGTGRAMVLLVFD